MLMKLTTGDDLPLTLGRKVVKPAPVDISLDLSCGDDSVAVAWVEHPAAGFADRKHPAAAQQIDPLLDLVEKIRQSLFGRWRDLPVTYVSAICVSMLAGVELSSSHLKTIYNNSDAEVSGWTKDGWEFSIAPMAQANRLDDGTWELAPIEPRFLQ
jgi:hypothetical protein